MPDRVVETYIVNRSKNDLTKRRRKCAKSALIRAWNGAKNALFAGS